MSPTDNSARPTRAPAHARGTRALAISSLLGLIALGLAWELWLAPLRPGGSWLALKVLPLTLPLVGLLKHRMYTYRWLSLLLWLYFTEGVVRAASDATPGAWLAMLEVGLTLSLFVACVLHVRLRQRAARQGSSQHHLTPHAGLAPPSLDPGSSPG